MATNACHSSVPLPSSGSLTGNEPFARFPRRASRDTNRTVLASAGVSPAGPRLIALAIPASAREIRQSSPAWVASRSSIKLGQRLSGRPHATV